MNYDLPSRNELAIVVRTCHKIAKKFDLRFKKAAKNLFGKDAKWAYIVKISKDLNMYIEATDMQIIVGKISTIHDPDPQWEFSEDLVFMTWTYENAFRALANTALDLAAKETVAREFENALFEEYSKHDA